MDAILRFIFVCDLVATIVGGGVLHIKGAVFPITKTFLSFVVGLIRGACSLVAALAGYWSAELQSLTRMRIPVWLKPVAWLVGFFLGSLSQVFAVFAGKK